MPFGPLAQTRVNLDEHSGLAADSDHKVDGVKPTLSSANASGDLTKVVLSFSEAIGTVDNTKITVKKGGTDQTTTGAAIDSTDSNKVEITLMTALLTTDTNITVDLAADAVTDVPGNGNAEDLATAVSLVDNTAPTFVSAGTNGTDEVVLTYSEALNTTQPATSAFTVKVGGTSRGVDTVAISGRAVTLTLASAFRPGDALTVAYSKPGTNPIKDAADNEADSLAETAVTNNLAATAPDAPSSLVTADSNVPGTANEYGDRLGLFWSIPWHNGSDITKFQYRYAEGTSVPPTSTWVDIPDKRPDRAEPGLIHGGWPRRRHPVHLRGARGERHRRRRREGRHGHDAVAGLELHAARLVQQQRHGAHRGRRFGHRDGVDHQQRAVLDRADRDARMGRHRNHQRAHPGRGRERHDHHRRERK